MNKLYFLISIYFGEEEVFCYVLNNAENIAYINDYEKNGDHGRLYIIVDRYFSESIVDAVVSSSGLNDIGHSTAFHKCDTINDIIISLRQDFCL